MNIRIPSAFTVLAAFAILFTFHISVAFSQQEGRTIPVNAREAMQQLLADEDTDGDLKITIDDSHVPGTERGNKRFWLHSMARERFEVAGVYHLCNLLQELTLLSQAGRDTSLLRFDRVFEPAVDRISRSIREHYWDALTRRIDEDGLPGVLQDEKTSTVSNARYIYVPPSDLVAVNYFREVRSRHPAWRLLVVQLPDRVVPQYVRGLEGYHGILSLGLRESPAGTMEGIPFVVPGGRFNEMYGWDSYFILLGLLADGRIDLAKSLVDNFVYELTHYGAILNANRTYYLTRSQPPFLTSMIRECYRHLPKDSTSHKWLRTALAAAIQEYKMVWMQPQRRTAIGLNRYFDSGSGPPPEVEPGHFDDTFRRYAAKHRMTPAAFERAYRSGRIKDPELDRYFVHDRAMRESGHDTSYRLINQCADLATVDLNALLYRIERDIAEVIEQEFGGSLTLSDGKTERSTTWSERAEERKKLINQYLWDPGRGMFFDYSLPAMRRTGYVSATTLYPLWARLATPEQAAHLVSTALPLLEAPGGILSSTESSRGPISEVHPLRQWDYPHGWAPHQMLVWQGLARYGMGELAQRLAYRWLFTITLNATLYNGTITEKYDVARRSHEVFAEYGNVGTKFSYITREGFGWTNASFQVGRSLLTPDLLEQLNNLIPPEWIFLP